VLATMDPEHPERLWPSGQFGAGTQACNVQHGAAGVLAVLARASQVLDRAELTDATARVAAWVAARARHAERALPGLYFGRSGTAWALYNAARHLGDGALAGTALELARSVPTRWPNPDVFHGAAGAGLLHLNLWLATGDAEFLDRAADAADGLVAAAVQTADGLAWPVPLDFDSELAGIQHLGFAHGVAGVGLFLLAAAQATGRPAHLDAALAAGQTLRQAAELRPWGARWRADLADKPGTGLLYHLCSGSSGVGTFLHRLWLHTGDAETGELACAAARAVHNARWQASPVVCHGLAGDGDFLLDVAADRGEPYRELATDLAGCLYARHAVRDGRLVLPDESGFEIVADYGVGLAGAAAFLLRLRYGGPRLFLPGDTPAETSSGQRTARAALSQPVGAR
jgi:lantibiotic modifying enzyme